MRAGLCAIVRRATLAAEVQPILDWTVALAFREAVLFSLVVNVLVFVFGVRVREWTGRAEGRKP